MATAHFRPKTFIGVLARLFCLALSMQAVKGAEVASQGRRLIISEAITDEQLREAISGRNDLECIIFHQASGLTDLGLKHLSSLPSLRELRLHHRGETPDSRFTREGFGHLSSARRLEILGVSGVSADFFLEAISGNHALKNVSLDDVFDFSETGTRHLPSLRNLTTLEIVGAVDGTVLTQGMFMDFGKCQKLEEIFLNIPTPREFDVDKALAHLAAIPLTSLTFLETPFTDAAFDRLLAQWPEITLLSFDHSSLSDESLANFPKMGHLDELWLMTPSDNNDKLAAYLAESAALRVLSIGERLSDGGLSHLAGMAGLKTLTIYSDRVTDAGLLDYSGKGPGIHRLVLARAAITDAGLARMDSLNHLESFAAAATASRITDIGLHSLSKAASLAEVLLPRVKNATIRGLEALASAPNMKKISIGKNPEVTEGEINELRRDFPSLSIWFID